MPKGPADKGTKKAAGQKSFARIAVDDEVSLRVPSLSKYKKAAQISKSAPVSRCRGAARRWLRSRSRSRWSFVQVSTARPASREMPGHRNPNPSSSKALSKAAKQRVPEPEEVRVTRPLVRRDADSLASSAAMLRKA
jgi:hypothetical protein